MRYLRQLTFAGKFFGVAVLICGFSFYSTQAKAQTLGDNAVYNSSGSCTSSSCGFSGAFIDASVFGLSTRNICQVLNGILSSLFTTYPAGGAVIDARGLPATGTSMTCTTSPWAGITNPPPSTILLPATGSGTSANPIVISSTWILPTNTHLIGEGDGLFGTTIQMAYSISLTPMIQFGSSSVCGSSACTGISVENLTLDGKAQYGAGITNQYAQNNSYVNHVRLYEILGTGLFISSSGSSSAPPGKRSDPWIFTGIHGFLGPPDGDFPAASLVFDKNGDLFSTTQAGGTGTGCGHGGCGVVFEVKR